MDTYEAWMKEWNQWKHKWIRSEERVDQFVICAVPPGGKYSTMTHYELSMAISDITNIKTHINNKDNSIELRDGYALTPSVSFLTEKAKKNYPRNILYGMTLSFPDINTDPLDVLDNFGFLSLQLNDFKRVYILQVVKAMETLRFGVLHNGGIVSSSMGPTKDSTYISDNRFHTKLPHIDDPVWFYV